MKPATILKIVVALAALAGIGWYLQYSNAQRQAHTEYNRIVDQLMNTGKNQEALDAFEKLLPNAPPDVALLIHQHIAQCCLRIGDDPGLSIKEAARWFAKAQSHDPGVLNETQQQVLKLGGKE